MTDQLVRLALEPLTANQRGRVIALGNFDGVHLGHACVVQTAAQWSGGVAAAVFEPHPRRFFAPDSPPFRLQSSRQRVRALCEAGAEFVVEIPFDAAVASMSDETFAMEILHRRIGVRGVATGADFRFGRGRMGSPHTLREFGETLGFQVLVADAVDDADADGSKISSSSIRAALADGRPDAAAAMLGRPWAIEGVVRHGFARGRTLGYPTLNVELGDYVRPRLGVYATMTDLGDGVWRHSVSSLGLNPTIGALNEPLLETHVFDWSGDAYDRCVETRLVSYLRPEAKFDSLEALVEQIDRDAAHARAALSRLQSTNGRHENGA